MASKCLCSRHALWLSWLAPLLLVSVVEAQPSPAERETARSAMQAGDQLRQSGDLQGALSRYRSAHALMHVPTTGLAVAEVEAQLGLLVEARNSCLEVVNIPEVTGESKLFTDARKDASLLAVKLEPRVPSFVLEVTPAQIEYRVSIDGATLPPAARGIGFKVNPGVHSVVVEANGFHGQSLQITLAEAQHFQVPVTLQPAPQLAPQQQAFAPAPQSWQQQQQPPPPPRVDDRPASARDSGRVRGIIGLSVGGVALLTGSVAGVISLVKTSNEKDKCQGDHCFVSQKDALSSATTWANVSNIGLGLGVLGIGYGLYELLTLPAEPESSHARGLKLELTGTGAQLRGEL
jgi:hypothetical protein